MQCQNFESLRAKRAMLADLGGIAERYVHDDPSSSLLDQRVAGHAVTAIETEITADLDALERLP